MLRSRGFSFIPLCLSLPHYMSFQSPPPTPPPFFPSVSFLYNPAILKKARQLSGNKAFFFPTNTTPVFWRAQGEGCEGCGRPLIKLMLFLGRGRGVTPGSFSVPVSKPKSRSISCVSCLYVPGWRYWAHVHTHTAVKRRNVIRFGENVEYWLGHRRLGMETRLSRRWGREREGPFMFSPFTSDIGLFFFPREEGRFSPRAQIGEWKES